MNLTVEEAYELYIRFVMQKKKPQSVRSIDSRFKNYILPFFKNEKIKNIDLNRYLSWQEWILKMGFSYKYKKALHYSCVALFNFLIKFYDVKKNIPSMVGNFKNDELIDTKIHVWNKKEFKKFIHQVDDNQYRLLFKMLYKTGMRQGELLALTWNDFDIKNRTISISKTISKESINGSRIINSPKTKKSIRKIQIDFLLSWELKRYMKYYIKNNHDFNSSMFIFGFRKALAPSTIERKKNQWCDSAHVKRIRIHDFRHSHASYLLSHNIPITAVAERLGHADIAMTLNTYSHVLKRDEKRVLRTLSFLGW